MGILGKSLTFSSAATLTDAASRRDLFEEITLVHSTSRFSSSMSRFSFARLFWNHVITWRRDERGGALVAVHSD
ncbi:hypothetical protein E2C01_042662 [Portunus trituberculatus]|uniref:Uncharacterized protein n=1 Tax=Portunus trituberculatus TaxID=210409 RepID=A0A5B7FTL9_PORTR|nr:hypothetical protein [Portunus trituberculatus]